MSKQTVSQQGPVIYACGWQAFNKLRHHQKGCPKNPRHTATLYMPGQTSSEFWYTPRSQYLDPSPFVLATCISGKKSGKASHGNFSHLPKMVGTHVTWRKSRSKGLHFPMSGTDVTARFRGMLAIGDKNWPPGLRGERRERR